MANAVPAVASVEQLPEFLFSFCDLVAGQAAFTAFLPEDGKRDFAMVSLAQVAHDLAGYFLAPVVNRAETGAIRLDHFDHVDPPGKKLPSPLRSATFSISLLT
ncbi:MAG: hypothetical protein ACM3PB_00605 [Betaproteobacteria bacterium]